jgi:uncharacterized protein
VGTLAAMSRSPHEILAQAGTIAVVGASRDPEKDAGAIPAVLQAHGFRIVPVNPFADILFGERVYRRLADIPDHVDIVDVFRPAAEAAGVARQAVAIGAGAVWLQQDIVSEEARAIAEAGGLEYVEDRCIAVERALHRIEARPA